MLGARPLEYTFYAMRILSVSQALAYLRELIENDLVLGDVWVSGEVSGPRTQPSGHTYFTLKDAGSQLRSVLFRAAMQRQRRMADYLTQGSQVIVHGRLTVYEARGELQVVVDFVQPEGVGLKHAQFERLRLRLEEEGLFDPTRKRSLPTFPERIGVVTSPVGAVFHDICNVLRRRWPLAEVVLAPTPVQGPEAPLGVSTALETLNLRGDLDVIIVARGGGSVEELWTFNEESVARAVFGSLVPVVSAVGHETDYTICDYVADLRAPTPSAAAELVVPDCARIAGQLRALTIDGLRALTSAVDSRSTAIISAVARAERGATDLKRIRRSLDDLERRSLAATLVSQRERGDLVRRCQVQLDALNPQATLNRGYAVVHQDGHVVSSVAKVASGDSLIIKVADGGFPARVSGPGSKRTRSKLASKNGSTPAKELGVQPVLFP
jgi:exodeoxyribonuclease VII large subunit